MPKTTPESEYIKYMASLQSKIRAEEIGLQSWKGAKRTQVAPIKPTVNDLLLGGEKLNKAQKLQTKMLDEYLEKQKNPIVREIQAVDEDGNEMFNTETGQPIMIKKEFKYHALPLPELLDFDLEIDEKVEQPPLYRLVRNVDTGKDEVLEEPQSPIIRRIRETIPVEQLQNADQYLKQKLQSDLRDINKQIEISSLNIRYGDDVIKQLAKERTELKQAKQEAERALFEQFDKEVEQLKLGPIKGRKTRIKERQAITNSNIKDLRRQLEAELRANTEDINRIRQGVKYDKEVNIPRLLQQKDDIELQFGNAIARLNDVQQENKKLLAEYQKELQNMNIGSLNTERNIDETDLEYAERLNAIVNETIPSERNLEKASQAQKEDLRENLKTLIRDNSIIESVVNEISSKNMGLVYELNKTFLQFKKEFIKKYGEYNKNVNAEDILKFIFINQATIENEMDKQMVVYQQKLERNIPENISENIPSSSPYISERTRNLLNTDYSAAGPYAPIKEEEEEEVVVEESSQFAPLEPTIIDEETLRYVNPENGKQAFLKLGYVTKRGKKRELTIFISPSNKPTTYRSTIFTTDPINGIRELLIKYLGTPNIKNLNIGNPTQTKEAINQLITPTDTAIDKLSGENKGEREIFGFGLKMSDDVETIPTIINFGLVFLLLRKLYLHNILSIQNKYYKKVSGFQNIKVSDTFVEIIQDILNNKNYLSKLSHLSSNEREIFDQLLYIAGLHKKLNGGSIADTNKFKKELEVLEGEIQAGNNNKGLQKQLFNLLQKMAHYKMISSSMALKHYKQFDPYFK